MVSFLVMFGAQTFPTSSSSGPVSVSVGDIPVFRARSNDPQTSKDAAEKVDSFAHSHAGKIHRAITGRELTAHEISCLTGLTVVQIDRRLPEMKRAGFAEVVQEGGQDMTRDGFRVWTAC